MTDQTSAPTYWIDGHPQLEAIAAAVWERCEHHDSGLIIDDPRNIAVAALAAVLPAPVDRAAVLREAADRFDQHAEQLLDGVADKAVFVAKALQEQAAVWSEAAETLRRLAGEAPQALLSIHANDVQGFCPACGHPTLYVGDSGHLTCSLMDCPKPEAADELLHAVGEAQQEPTQDGEQPTLRERHRAAWNALTPAEQDARLTALDAIDGVAGSGQLETDEEA